MKIVIVAPVHHEVEFIKQNKNPFPKGQAQLGWYEALKDLGHSVYVFRYTDTYIMPQVPRIYIAHLLNVAPAWRARFSRLFDRLNLFRFETEERSKKFNELMRKVKPDLIIISGGSFGLDKEVLKAIKKDLKTKVVLFSGVNPIYGASALDKELVKNKFFDYIFINDLGYAKNWEKMGAKNVTLLPVSAANPKIHKKVRLKEEEIKKFSSDIVFVGTLSSYRQRILSKLTRFNLKIWGIIPPGEKLFPELKNYYKGEALGEKMVKVYAAAKIGLNIHEEDMRYGGNLKTFEIPAIGTLQLIDNLNSEWFKDGEEVVKYKNIEDLISKIDHLLKDEGKISRIAEKGYKRTMAEHTYKNRFKKMLTIVFKK